MKNRKLKIFSVLLSLLMICPLMPLNVFAKTSGDFEYSVYDDGTAVILGYSGSDETLSIPSEIKGHKVAVIYSNAFENCISLKSVTIPKSVITIGSGAFYGCSNLQYVTIPNSVKTINFAAFSGTALKSVSIPASVTDIGYAAFSECGSLTRIDVDKNNRYYSSDEAGVLFNKYKTILIQCPDGINITEYAIPKGVTDIYGGAFANCGNIKSITIPEGVVGINTDTFRSCGSLKSVSIPKSVTEIGQYAFADCVSLESIKIPDRVTIIGAAAFSNCSSLKNVSIGNGVKTIEWEAFKDCDSLESITIPDSVMYITEYAFSSCDSLTSVKIGSGVVGISLYAFEKCGNLKSISIPKGITYIGDGAFSGCESISDVYYEGSEWMWNLIEILFENECLTTANIHFGGDESTESGLTLHHGDLEPHKGMSIATMNAEQTAEKILYEMRALSDRIVDKNGKVLAKDDFVGTGAKLQAVRDGIVMGEYTVIVYMDINGDGKITAADARIALRASARLEKLEGVFATAANVDYDGVITAAYARRILRVSAKLERP